MTVAEKWMKSQKEFKQKANKVKEEFDYNKFGKSWDKKFGEGSFNDFEEKWNKAFGTTVLLDHQLKQKFDSLPDIVRSEDIETDYYDLFRKLNPQDAVTGQLKEKVSKHATDKSWENTEGWNTLSYNKEKIK